MLDAVYSSKIAIAVSTLVCAAVVAVAVGFQPSTYLSEVQIQIRADNSTSVLTGVDTQTSSDRTRVVNTEVGVVTSDAVIDPAAITVGMDSVQLRENLSVNSSEDSDLIVVAFQASSPELAQRAAEELSRSYQQFSQVQGSRDLTSQADALQIPIDSLKSSIDSLPGQAVDQRAALGDQLGRLSQQQQQIRSAAGVYQGTVRILAGATLPSRSSSISIPVGIAAGAALGLVVGVAVSFIRQSRPARRGGRVT